MVTAPVSYRLAVPASSAIAVFIVIGALPLVVSYVVVALLGQGARLPLLLPAGFLILAALLALALRTLGAGSISIGQQRISASAMWYRIEAGGDDIIAAGVKRVSSLKEVQLHMRTNGIGLPGYRVGWYRISIHGARHTAFLLVTGAPLLLVPLKSGTQILVSCPLEQAHDALVALGATQGAPTT